MTARYKDISRSRKRKTSSWQTILFSAVLSILLAITIIFLLVSSWRVTVRRAELEKQLKAVQENVRELEEKNKELKLELPQTQTLDYLEKKIREQGYKKPGEEVAVVVPSQNGLSENAKPKGFWQDLWQRLGL
ncbi:MAG: septum formation initiator family protein [Patescibacteria group bacterium]|mgnify:CR=1 FL=1